MDVTTDVQHMNALFDLMNRSAENIIPGVQQHCCSNLGRTLVLENDTFL